MNSAQRTFVVAAVAGALAVLPLSAGAEDGALLGRLFSASSERKALDTTRDRLNNPEPIEIVDVDPVIEDAPEEAIEEAPTLTVNGIVRRANGRSTVWINGVDSYAGDVTGLGISRLGSPNKEGGVTLEVEQEVVRLKPGQSFDPNEQRKADLVDP